MVQRYAQSWDAVENLMPKEDGPWVLYKDYKIVSDRMARLVEAATTFQRESVVLSEKYLEAFQDWKEDDCIQGWEKSRWKRALTARNNLDKAIAKAKEA